MERSKLGTTSIIALFLAGVLVTLTACMSVPAELPAPIRQTPQTPTLNSITRQLPLRIISLTSPIAPQGYATLVAETLPSAECTIMVDYRALASNISGFHSQIADGNGRVSWTWQVGNGQGTWDITVKAEYGGQTASTVALLTIGNLQWDKIPQPQR